MSYIFNILHITFQATSCCTFHRNSTAGALMTSQHWLQLCVGGIIIILLKDVGSKRLGETDLNPISPKTPAPQLVNNNNVP